MARYMIEVETEEAGAEERLATLKALVSSAFRMKVVSAEKQPPPLPAIDTGTRTITAPPPEGSFRPVMTPAPPPDVEVEEPNTGEVTSR